MKCQSRDARLRMARIPGGATLIDNPVSSAPGIKIDNVYVLAGVPNIMQAMLDGVVLTLRHGPSIKPDFDTTFLKTIAYQ